MATSGPGAGRRTSARSTSATRPAARSQTRPGAPRAPRSSPSATGSTPPAGSPWLSRRLLVLGTVFVVLAILLTPTVHAYLAQRSQISALRDTVAQQKKDVAKLTTAHAQWTDNAYVEQQARERLKFVKVGETSYTVIDADPAAPIDSTLATAPASSDDHPWYGRLWESMRVADAPAANP
ncbi:MAG: septum formation initiator family protein [Nostocoides sp.]